MNSLHERFDALLDAVMNTAAEEIDCDDFLSRAAELLEAMARESLLPEDLTPVSRHLAVCPECREEFEALIRAVGSRQAPGDDDTSPGTSGGG